jgi:hypothetical protein
MIAVERRACRLRDDRATLDDAGIARFAAIPDPGKGDRLAICGPKQPRLFLAFGTGPFIPSRSRDQATPPREALFIGPRRRDSLGPRIERGETPFLELAMIKPRDQPPPRAPNIGLAVLEPDDRSVVGRPHLRPRLEIERGLLGNGDARGDERGVQIGPAALISKPPAHGVIQPGACGAGQALRLPSFGRDQSILRVRCAFHDSAMPPWDSRRAVSIFHDTGPASYHDRCAGGA